MTNRKPWTTAKCSLCFKEFALSPTSYKSRMKLSKSGRLFCSYKCLGESRLAKRIKEGEIIVTREQVIHAFAQAFCEPGNTHKEMDTVLGMAMVRILFGEVKE